MLSKFRDIGANVSVKIHYLICHLDHFSKNLSEEQEERFDQDFNTMEESHQVDDITT